LIALLLGLDAVTQSSVTSTLRQIEGGVATIGMQGSVSGAVRGVSSDVDFEARYDFDTKQRRTTWFTISLKENRSIGHAEPGFEAVARLQMTMAPGESCPQLSDGAIRGLPVAAGPGTLLLRFSSPQGGFRFLYGQHWRVMIDRHDVAVLRLIDQGDLIGQCNASRLPDLAVGQRVPLETFQADVQRALGDSFGQFVEASQTSSEQGLRLLRAVVSGVASELPVQWTYYHISDDHGHQVALVFTMDSRLVARFAEADRTIISSLEFLPLPNPPAERASSSRNEDGETAASASNRTRPGGTSR
jgi:hypothetical protein